MGPSDLGSGACTRLSNASPVRGLMPDDDSFLPRSLDVAAESSQLLFGAFLIDRTRQS